MTEDFYYDMSHMVIYSEIDARGLLSLPSFFSLFQEAALLQAEKLGFGESYCKKEGLMWVLSRLSMEVESFPSHRDRVHLRTWPKQPKGPFALRDFILYSEDGEAMARATSAWLLLKADTFRPVRPGPLFEKFPLAGLGEAIPGAAEKIGGEERDPSLELEVSARYSDLDQNDHVNNTRYVRWFLDCYSPEEVAPVEELCFSINYLQAAGFNDRLRLRRCDTGNESTVRGFLEDGTESFAARIGRFSSSIAPG